MMKELAPATSGIREYYCDCCKVLIGAEGVDKEPEKEMSVYFSANFGPQTSLAGTTFNQVYCSDCGLKAVIAVETALNITLQEVYK